MANLHITSSGTQGSVLAGVIARVSDGVSDQWANETVRLLKARANSRTLQRFIIWRRIPGGVRISCEHPLGMWMEYGTGLYGPQRRRIVPTRMKVLRWVQNGRVRYAPSTRGMRKRPFWWRTINEQLQKAKGRV